MENLKKSYFIVIVGLGSIGRRHAEYFSSIKGEMIFIDPSKTVFTWAKETKEDKYKIFKNIEDAKPYIVKNNLPKIAVISNLGHQHYSSVLELYDMGFKNFFIEKPVVNALYQIDKLTSMIIDGKINIVTGFGWRYSGLPEKITNISKLHLGGVPLLINMVGGAFGMVTNGIHYLDLAVSIFNSNPLSVISDLDSQNINPRSNKLDFWEGSSVWNFPDGKKLIINASNQSSVSSIIQVICPKGKIVINEDMSVSTYKRDDIEIAKDPRVTRLGKPVKLNELNFKPDKSKVYDILFLPLFEMDKKMLTSVEREMIATKSIIYSLISSSLEQKLNINDDVDEKYYNMEWMIS